MNLEHNSCKTFYVGSLAEYLEVIQLLDGATRKKHGQNEKPGKIARMWFRGHTKSSYTLLPTLLRDGKEESPADYGRNHLREDLRYQHFRSKNTHLVNTSPESKIEWLEIMQHHLGKTRLMDWSESAISSLMFALLSHRRLSMTPAVWALDPMRLNEHIFQYFSKHESLAKDAVGDITRSGKDRLPLIQAIMTQLQTPTRIFDDNDELGINGIVCLSVIWSEYHANADRLYNLLLHREFNAFFYLLLRYYNDGLPVAMNTLPPLAVVHPYHSRRIEYQHGVFTIVPHYQIEKEQIGSVHDCRPMERQPAIRDCLYKICITRPARVAKELLMLGERTVGLYPDIDKYVQDIEAKTWQI